MKKVIVLALLLVGIQANAQFIGGAGYIYSSEKTTEKSWVVPGRGDVKTVTYDKKGNLTSTTEMISFTK